MHKFYIQRPADGLYKFKVNNSDIIFKVEVVNIKVCYVTIILCVMYYCKNNVMLLGTEKLKITDSRYLKKQSMVYML